MGIGDRLLAKTAGVGTKGPEASPVRPASTEARTSPGRLMDAQNTINLAHNRIKELEGQLAQRSARELDLDLLVEVPGRRRKLTAEQFGELKSNLAQHPLSTPILVRSLSDGKYELVAGHNRVSAYRELGRKAILANVITVDEREVEFAAFFSNLLSPSLSDFEKYWNFKRLQEISGLSRTEISESAGLSKSHVTRIFSFDALPDDAKAALSEKPERLGSNAAQKLAALVAAGKAEKVAEAVQKLVTDSSFTQDQAVSFATQKPVRAASSPATVIRSGKKKYCEISARNGVVGIRFFDGDAKAIDKWAERISQLIQAEMGSESE